MKSTFFKQLMIAYIILRDQFRDNERTLEDLFWANLEQGRPIAVRLKNGNYRLFLNNWAATNAAQLTVAPSLRPDKFAPADRLSIVGHPAFVDVPTVSPFRHYFRFEQRVGDRVQAITVGERLLPFKGTTNFRDLGGYPTTDGKHVKWGLLFRSDHLRKFRPADQAYFAQLNMATICDFRGEEVVKHFPDKLPKNHCIQILRLPLVSEGLEMSKMRSKIVHNDMDDYDAKAILLNTYKRFIGQDIPIFKTVLEQVFANRVPILMHCSAGKDRTGFISAIILSLLGVSNDVIMADFLSSNFFRKYETEKYIRYGSMFTNMERLTPLLEVMPEYMQQTLRIIQEKYGSTSEFVKQTMGFSDKDIQKLKEYYLE